MRVPLRTLDGALFVMAYRGVRSGPSEVLQRVARGDAVDPASYYYRVAGSFETASPELAWLNAVVAVAVGSRSRIVDQLGVGSFSAQLRGAAQISSGNTLTTVGTVTPFDAKKTSLFSQ